MLTTIENAAKYRDEGLLQDVIKQAIQESDEDYGESSNPVPILQFSKDIEEEDGDDSFSFYAGFTEGFGGYLISDHHFGTIEQELFYDMESYSSQDMEAVSSLWLRDCNTKDKKVIFEKFSDIFGTFFSSPDKPKFNKVTTKDCVNYLSSFTNNTKHKRTSKRNIGHFIVREFDNEYQIIEYKGCLIMVSRLFV